MNDALVAQSGYVFSGTALVVMAGVSLLGACAGMVGTFAVLRRRALTGDALAHATLPGLCVAVLLVGGRDLSAMLVGAFAAGLVGIGVIAALRRWTRVKEDAAIGIVLSVFFGVGIVLNSVIQRSRVAGDSSGLQDYIFGHAASLLERDVYQIGALAVVCTVIVALLYKEFQLLSFDPGFAKAQGWPNWRLDFGMMALIAAAVVLGLPAVGVVLMAALLILPGVTARLWTDRLHRLLPLAAFFGALTGALGTALSARFQGLPAGPIITLVGTGLFVISVVIAPKRGLIVRMTRAVS